ncbi:MAG: methyltransferase domain-containing protein [Candidatus Sericytochromatia bacterium]
MNKLGLLPLFKAESFQHNQFTASGLEYFAANGLAEIIAYVAQETPEITTCIAINLMEMVKKKPDLVLIWSTSPCFGQVQPLAEQLRTYLDVPIWLAGPHISYLPNSLPPAVDAGILGEPEIPLQQLLSLWLKMKEAGPALYRKVPGIIYQSRGRMYSGAPAHFIAQLQQLPIPDYRPLLNLPGMGSAIIRTSRVSDNLLTALAYPPSRKPRLQHPEHICRQLEHAIENYRYLFRSYPLPADQMRYLRPVIIPDYQLVLHKGRLEALVKEVQRRGLHRECFLIVHTPPDALDAQVLECLKALNTRKILISFGPFGHKNPLLPTTSPEAFLAALERCAQAGLSVWGQFYLNPDVDTSRQQLAQTYLFLQRHLACFERLRISVMGTFPGTSLWEEYQARHKPDNAALGHFPWASLDFESFSRSQPLVHKHLGTEALQEIYFAFERLSQQKTEVEMPLQADGKYQSQLRMVQQFATTYLQPQEHILELVSDPQLALKPFLHSYHPIDQLEVRNGHIAGTGPRQAVDLLVLNGSLNTCRHPGESLKHMLRYLKPGGRVFIQVLNPLYMVLLNRYFHWKFSHSSQSNPVLHFLKEEELRALLESAGLEILSCDYTIMEGVESVRASVESLAHRLQHFAALKIPQHMLYISDIKMLARNRS